jgi:hypothetical protein
VRLSVARCTQRDQVQLGIFAGLAAKLLMVDFQSRHRAAGLTPPAVAPQDLLAQTFVRQGVEPRESGLGANRFQDNFSLTFSSFVQLDCTIDSRLTQRPKGNRRTRTRFSSTTIMLPSLKGCSITGIALNNNRN